MVFNRKQIMDTIKGKYISDADGTALNNAKAQLNAANKESAQNSINLQQATQLFEAKREAYRIASNTWDVNGAKKKKIEMQGFEAVRNNILYILIPQNEALIKKLEATISSLQDKYNAEVKAESEADTAKKAAEANLRMITGQADAYSDPDIAKAKALLAESLAKASQNKVIVISIVVLIALIAGGFFYLKYKKKV